MRKTIAIVLSTLVTLALAVLLSRYAFDSWYFYIAYSIQVQAGAALVAAGILIFLIRPGIYSLLLIAAAGFATVDSWKMLGEFSQGEAANGRADLTVISFNILGDNNTNGAKIADMIVASGADVVFLQESAPIGPFIPQIKAAYPYRTGCGAGTVTCDLSLWSKHPFVTSDVLTASPLYRDRFMRATIQIGEQTVTLMTAHLSKPYFDAAHAIELKRIGDYITASEGPLVLAGDFNVSLLAPDVQKMLRRTGMRNLTPEPATWPVEAIQFGIAIDHLFVRAPLQIKAIDRLPDHYGSNHFGLKAELSLSR